MSDLLNITDLRLMFAEATRLIQREQETLSQLDSIGGDGDHGTTMLRTMEKLDEALSTNQSVTFTACLKDAGWNVLGVDGGASSAILGTFIAGMGDVEIGQECDCKCLAESLLAGLSAVFRQSNAKRGDKTMIDALEPAVQAFADAAKSNVPIARAMECSAHAAQEGAEDTTHMIARFGRAKFLGERTRGSPDAGATSIALLFRGFSIALQNVDFRAKDWNGEG
jgi:dihydroxyacetone kinase-like protein